MHWGAVTKMAVHTYQARGCLQYHALATVEDTRHCFQRVANLTIIHMFAAHKYSAWGGLVREVSVVGPAPTPSSVCTHCLSRSCDQHSGHKKPGTLLNSPGHDGGCLGRLQVVLRNVHAAYKEKSGK